jgi:hypothetical protein
MLTALYYPHVTIGAGLVRNALFLWDRIEYIGPHEEFSPQYEDAEVGEAVKRFGALHVPSKQQQAEAGRAIIELLKLGGLPPWFYVENIPPELRYKFYPEKLGLDTWDLLKKEKLAEEIGDGFDTSAPLGLTIMSILADCCAGTQKRLITDEAISYSALDRYLMTIGGGNLGEFDNHSDRLVTKSLRIMNLQDVSLGTLVSLREKEETASGTSLRALRHKYLREIEECANSLATAKSESDAEEIERVFEQKLKDDFNLLKDELKDEAKKVIFSKEMATAIVGCALSVVEPISGLLVAGGALYRKKVEYRSARNAALRAHSMSWLYSAKKVQIY